MSCYHSLFNATAPHAAFLLFIGKYFFSLRPSEDMKITKNELLDVVVAERLILSSKSPWSDLMHKKAWEVEAEKEKLRRLRQ